MVPSQPVADQTSNNSGEGEQPKLPYHADSALPKPRRRLWRTLFKWPRPIRHFAPRQSFKPESTSEEDLRLAAHWGERILIEDYVVVLHRDGTTSAIRHLVTQLHGRESLESWDEWLRSYDVRTQNIRILRAGLYSHDGKFHRAQIATHRVAAPSKRPNLYGRTLQITYSPLRPGVIVEFEESYDEFQPGEPWPGIWGHYFLQTGAPCRYRRHVVAVAEPFKLSFRSHHGALPPQQRHEKGFHVCTWEATDVPGVEFDGWTPPLRDFAPWVDISTADSWAPFAHKFKTELASESQPTMELNSLASELARNKAALLEKAAAAYTYAARTVRYGRPRREMEVRNARGSSQVFQDLQGDCKDKSALLVQLLRAMNMPADIAVVLTADEGRSPYLPSNRFNHAIVRTTIDGKVYWLDAASGEFAFGELPSIDQDIPALVLGEDSFHFDHVPPQGMSEHLEFRDNKGRLLIDGSYEGTFQIEYSGEEGARLRAQFIDRTEEHRSKVLQAWLGTDYPSAVGENFSSPSLEGLSGKAVYKCDVKIPQVARQIKSILLLQIPWAGRLSMQGPFASEQRLQPLMLPPSHLLFERHLIDLPPGVSVFAMPEAVKLSCDWGEYSCDWQEVDGHLECQRLLRYGGRQVPSDRFVEFKEFWRQGSLADTTPIVLRVEGL